MYQFWHTYTMKAKWANKAGEISHMSFLLLWVLSTTLLLNIYVRVCLRLSTKPFVIIWAKRSFPILKYLLEVCANICRIYFVWFMYMKKLIFLLFCCSHFVDWWYLKKGLKKIELFCLNCKQQIEETFILQNLFKIKPV